MSKTRRRLVSIGVVVAMVLAIGYWAADNHLVFGPTVFIRNETASLAWVDVAGWNDDGDDKIRVPSWQPGMCASGSWTWHHHGVPAAAGNATVVMFAGGLEPLTPFLDGQPLYVRVDASGTVHTGEPVPADAPGCAPYSLRWA